MKLYDYKFFLLIPFYLLIFIVSYVLFKFVQHFIIHKNLKKLYFMRLFIIIIFCLFISNMNHTHVIHSSLALLYCEITLHNINLLLVSLMYRCQF